MELDADGKPCRACTASKETLESLKQPKTARPCPPDSLQLGNAGWTLLHSIAAYYPTRPDLAKQEAVRTFYSSFSQLYPCSYCADELKADLAVNAVKAESREALSIWTCEMHNRVNERLGKEVVPCTMEFLGQFLFLFFISNYFGITDQRWLDGWKDGSCD